MKRCSLIIFIIIFIPVIFWGCGYLGPGSADYSYKLSSKYIIYRPSSDCTELDKKENRNMTVIVDSRVSGIAWDENFILAEQTKNNSKNYWIIDVKQDKVYGQLKYEDFDKHRYFLKIDSKLRLENPDKYKILDPSNK
ncbi:DUF3997 domain-containing protein [Clostridium beijerinckii]|uniref:DUF3997 domain-containing protein n=1 Tax=Clostridium beijerinckii TaxID=1520 RepID=UPI0009911EB6|nr:DUF3997 domain-containing protein [Clostridium beijerinckii]